MKTLALLALLLSGSSLAQFDRPIPAPFSGGGPINNGLPGGVNRLGRDKAFDTMNARDFGVVADGVTNDQAALQNAINQSIITGRTLILPETSSSLASGTAGCINIGSTSFTCGSTTAALCLNVGSQIVNMKGTSEGYGGGANSCILYTGTGRAMAINNACVPGVSGFPYNGSLKDFRIAMSNANNGTAVGLTTCNLQQTVMQSLNFDAIPATGTGNIPIGLSLQGATFIVKIYDTTCQGVGSSQLASNPVTPAIPQGSGNWTDCIYFDETASGGVGQTIFDGTQCFGVNNCYHLDSGAGANILFTNGTAECFNNFMLVTNTLGLTQFDGVTLSGNRPSAGCANADSSFLMIRETGVSKPIVLRDWQIYDNTGNCPASVNGANPALCAGVHNTTAANLSRTGATVTATISEVSGGLFFAGMHVYKTWNSGGSGANDAEFPGGMKTVATIIPANCNPVTGSPLCTGFTYTEAAACSGAGVCAAGCPGPCLSSSPSAFTSATSPIKHETQNAVRNNNSAVDLNIYNNQFQGWSSNSFDSYSIDAQSACTAAPNGCGILMVRESNNTNFCNFGGGLGFCVRNQFTTGAYVPQTEALTWTPASPELSGAGVSGGIAEVHISNTPTNQYAPVNQNGSTTAATIISLEHKRIRKPIAVTLNGASPSLGTASFYVPDVYSICNCWDITHPTFNCGLGSGSVPPFGTVTPTNPGFTATSVPIGNVAITVTATGVFTTTDVIEVDCS